jgi:fatty acid desaturase
MERSQWLTEVVKVGKKYHVKKQSKLRHCTTNLLFATGLWMCVAALLWCATIAPMWLYPVISILLGSCFFGHFILIIHECSHNMFLVTSNKKQTVNWNYQIGKWSSVPFMTAYDQHWGKGHVIHHLRPCESDDPQNPDPLDGKRLLRKLLIVWLVPFGFAPANPSSKYENRLMRMVLGGLVWAPIIWMMATIKPSSLLVIYGGFVIVTTLNLLKIAQEHGSGLATVKDPLLRSRTYFYPFAFLFSPFNIHYHFEHHVSFMVPWYLLPSFHNEIKAIVPQEMRSLIMHHTYWSQARGLFSVEGLDSVVLNNKELLS